MEEPSLSCPGAADRDTKTDKKGTRTVHLESEWRRQEEERERERLPPPRGLTSIFSQSHVALQGVRGSQTLPPWWM